MFANAWISKPNKSPGGNESFEVRSGLRLSIYDELPKHQDGHTAVAAARLFHYGERLRFPAKLSAPRSFRNPGAFDYRG